MPKRDVHWIQQITAHVEGFMTAIEHAKTIGTFGEDDRSKQYPLHDQKLVHKAINECWAKVHQLEAEDRRKDAEIAALKKELAEQKKRVKHYRIVTTTLISIITGVCWEGLKALIIFLR